MSVRNITDKNIRVDMITEGHTKRCKSDINMRASNQTKTVDNITDANITIAPKINDRENKNIFFSMFFILVS